MIRLNDISKKKTLNVTCRDARHVASTILGHVCVQRIGACYPVAGYLRVGGRGEMLLGRGNPMSFKEGREEGGAAVSLTNFKVTVTRNYN